MAVTKADLEARVAELEALLAKALEKIDLPDKDALLDDLDGAYDATTKELEERVAMLSETLDKVGVDFVDAVDLLREYAGDLDLGREARDFGGRVRGFLNRF